MFSRINWLAVVTAVIALEVLGYLWYGPVVGGAWMSAYRESFGHDPDLSHVAMTQSLGVINTLILTLGLAIVLPKLGVSGLKSVVAAALIWLAFNFTTMAIDYLYVGLGLRLVGINMGYQILAYVLAGAIIGWMPVKAATSDAED